MFGKSRILIFLAILTILLLLIFPLIVYRINFDGEISCDPALWGYFGSYIGGCLTLAVGALNAFLLYFIFTESRRKETLHMQYTLFEKLDGLWAFLSLPVDQHDFNDKKSRFEKALSVIDMGILNFYLGVLPEELHNELFDKSRTLIDILRTTPFKTASTGTLIEVVSHGMKEKSHKEYLTATQNAITWYRKQLKH